MKVSTKGQVSIPISIRRKAGIVPGCEVEFSEERGRLYLRVVANSGRGKALVSRMTGQGNARMSTDEILALTRGKR
ncbi:MAG TPA: AbrB/MazE/SpoVT family DNA-binding domain-containing protein [Candidatus Bathyarchaeia archaeon]|nr:AbrB/MazE/SpoVT family DNA-binding domain-containing protein [Candidatus Bathyarchaeia archaeon]